MTNQEAIKVLREKISPCLIAGEWKESVDVAISALQAQDVSNTNVGDMVSRQKAIDALCRRCDLVSDDEPCTEECNDIKILKMLPSAQPEIIKCKDCKYWREHKYAKETKRYIPFCGFNAIYTKADDFCSRAERRTDEDD